MICSPEVSTPSLGRIVVVDDDPELGEELKEDFTDEGFVAEHLDTPAARDAMPSQGAECSYVLDIDMGPGHMSYGFEALKELKRESPRTFVCIYSSHLVTHPENVRRAHRLGADLVLTKSHDRRADVKSIARAIELSKVEHDLEDLPIPPPRRSGTIRVNLTFTGKSTPIPEEDPWSNL
jgi:DNA-binding response OmpR family regulator